MNRLKWRQNRRIKIIFNFQYNKIKVSNLTLIWDLQMLKWLISLIAKIKKANWSSLLKFKVFSQTSTKKTILTLKIRINYKILTKKILTIKVSKASPKFLKVMKMNTLQQISLLLISITIQWSLIRIKIRLFLRNFRRPLTITLHKIGSKYPRSRIFRSLQHSHNSLLSITPC